VVVRNRVVVCPEGDCNGTVAKSVVRNCSVVLCCFDAGGVKTWCCVFKSDVGDGRVGCFDVK